MFLVHLQEGEQTFYMIEQLGMQKMLIGYVRRSGTSIVLQWFQVDSHWVLRHEGGLCLILLVQRPNLGYVL